ncbi:MAG: indole-3-glycerol phosphate synthase TrpC [Actinomycetes bacterium]|jgi:indole-3-glycerol phosphate synthase
MSTVLDSIVAGVLEDLKAREIPLTQLREQVANAPVVRNAFDALAKPGMQIIAEVKRSSPSKGALALIGDPAELASKYESAGAAVISVLTEGRRFGGSSTDLVAVRSAITIPVLRKDFIVTEYQVLETRALGADLLLLIVAALDDSQLRDFQALAFELGLSVLVEVHDEAELDRALAVNAKIIGVNARNLKTLEIHDEAFARLLPLIPSDRIRVAESGISTRQQVEAAEAAGAKAILVGETLVRAGDPALAISALLGR